MRSLLISPLFTQQESLAEAWPHEKVPQIVWLNEPTHKDFAHAGLAVSLIPSSLLVIQKSHHLSFLNIRQKHYIQHTNPFLNTPQYGNEPELDYRFSYAAILVVVPPSQKRATITPTTRETATARFERQVVTTASSASASSCTTTASASSAINATPAATSSEMNADVAFDDTASPDTVTGDVVADW